MEVLVLRILNDDGYPIIHIRQPAVPVPDDYVIRTAQPMPPTPLDPVTARAADDGLPNPATAYLQDVIVPWCGGETPAVTDSPAWQAETERKCVCPLLSMQP